MPLVLPTKTRPAATVGCPDAEFEFAYPNAHFSVSFGTSAAVSPAALAFWNRVFAPSLPQPFHIGSVAGSGSGVVEGGHAPVAGSAAAVGAAVAERNAATACFS